MYSLHVPDCIVTSNHGSSESIMRTVSPTPKPQVEGLNVLFARVCVHCDNRTWKPRINHDCNMRTSIWKEKWSKWLPFSPKYWRLMLWFPHPSSLKDLLLEIYWYIMSPYWLQWNELIIYDIQLAVNCAWQVFCGCPSCRIHRKRCNRWRHDVTGCTRVHSVFESQTCLLYVKQTVYLASSDF